jgi:hypothetical protein
MTSFSLYFLDNSDRITELRNHNYGVTVTRAKTPKLKRLRDYTPISIGPILSAVSGKRRGAIMASKTSRAHDKSA